MQKKTPKQTNKKNTKNKTKRIENRNLEKLSILKQKFGCQILPYRNGFWLGGVKLKYNLSNKNH